MQDDPMKFSDGSPVKLHDMVIAALIFASMFFGVMWCAGIFN